MKFQILQENLKNGLFIVSHTAGKSVNLPILHNILVEAKNGNIKLTSTNLEIGVSCLLRGKIEKEGLFTVDARIINDYIGALPNKKIDIELVDEQLLVVTDQQQTKINGQSAEDFPLIPVIDKDNGFEVDSRLLKEALGQVVFAVSQSDTRVELTGVLLVVKENSLVLVATDSYRLAEKKIPIKNIGKTEMSVIVPAKTIQEVLRIISGSKSSALDVMVYISDNQILFSYDTMEVVSRIIDGQYPDYTQIIPTIQKTSAKVILQELAKAVKAASIFSKNGVNDINLDLPLNKNELVVSAVSGQSGENISRVAAQIQGEDNGVVVNYRYLIDGLNNIETDTVLIGVVDANTPVVFRPEAVEGYLYIVMPIKQ
jgi:DNA polymerase-3 subunit beta